ERPAAPRLADVLLEIVGDVLDGLERAAAVEPVGARPRDLAVDPDAAVRTGRVGGEPLGDRHLLGLAIAAQRARLARLGGALGHRLSVGGGHDQPSWPGAGPSPASAAGEASASPPSSGSTSGSATSGSTSPSSVGIAITTSRTAASCARNVRIAFCARLRV